MKISATEEYGLRCLLRVARQPAASPISAQQIAQLEGISTPYAQKLLRVLTRCWQLVFLQRQLGLPTPRYLHLPERWKPMR